MEGIFDYNNGPTPGTWWVEGYYCVRAFNPGVPFDPVIRGDKSRYLNVVVTSNHIHRHDMAEANAYLIAAAPEMKRILEEIAEMLSESSGPATRRLTEKRKQIKDVLDKTKVPQ
jgi:hypothetical protein